MRRNGRESASRSLLVRLERARSASGDRNGQQLRVAKCVGDPVSGQRVFEVAGVTDECPSRSVALSEKARRSTEASQAADQRAALDIGTQPRAARLQNLEKAAP